VAVIVTEGDAVRVKVTVPVRVTEAVTLAVAVKVTVIVGERLARRSWSRTG